MKNLSGFIKILVVLLISSIAFAGDPVGDSFESLLSNPLLLIVSTVFYLAVILFLIIAQWKLFEKAGEPGWAAIVPIYNMIVMMKIAGRPEWWVLLLFVPFANLFAVIMMYIGLAKNFGRSDAFGIGLIFLPYVFLLILGYGSSRYYPVQQSI